MDTQHAGVTLIRSVAKLKLLKIDARSLYFERALYFAKLDLVSTEFFVRILTITFEFGHIDLILASWPFRGKTIKMRWWRRGRRRENNKNEEDEEEGKQ